jgi:F-type H+-transporting ATPase subunit c
MNTTDPSTIVTIVTIIASAAGISIGVIAPAIMEGLSVIKALEGIARQPEAAGNLRTTLLISLAILESLAIYVLLVVLVLIFANPLITRFFKV